MATTTDIEVGIMPIEPKKKPWVIMVTTGLNTRMGIRVHAEHMTLTFYELNGGDLKSVTKELPYAMWKEVVSWTQ